MKKEDIKLYHHIQRNAQLAMNALDAVTERVYDKELSVEMSREFITFADIHNRADEREGGGIPQFSGAGSTAAERSADEYAA